MAMTLKSLAAQMRAYRPEADEYKGKHIITSWADELDAIDAHLSAQAKVRVTDEDAGMMSDVFRDVFETTGCGIKAMQAAHESLGCARNNFEIDVLRYFATRVENHAISHRDDWKECASIMREAANYIESFAARLSKGAQGEAVAPRCNAAGCNCAAWLHEGCAWDDAEISTVPDVRAFEITLKSNGRVQYLAPDCAVIAESCRKNGNTVVPLYMHPAERADVPDGWVLTPNEPTQDMLNAARDWSLRVNGIGVGHSQATGCYQAMLTAAPQPPEGARVVDDAPSQRRLPKEAHSCVYPNGDGKCQECSDLAEVSIVRERIEQAIREHCSGGDLWLCSHLAAQHVWVLLAAPTLAGKEG